MAREDAYESERQEAPEADEACAIVEEETDDAPPPAGTYRHGDGSAQVLHVELLDASRRPVEFVESGDPVQLRVRLRFETNEEAPVCGFLLRNRHGIHLYGTNTELQRVDFGPVRRGEVVEVVFAFDCWLAPDTYSVTVAAHSLDGISYDWLDGALFFSVVSEAAMEGVANLNATAVARNLGVRASHARTETSGALG